MSQFRLLLIALIPFVFLTAQAQENVIVQKQPTVVMENSSEHNRMDKRFVVEAQLFGGSTLTGATTGAIIGYHLDRNTVIQAELTKGDGTNGNDSESLGFSEREGATVGLHAKRFLSNSFYVKGGLDYTKMKYNANYIWTSAPNKEAYGFEANLISAALVIGNQWQWDNFTLGCDWIGLTLPISHEITSEFNDKNLASHAQYNKDDQDTLLKNGTGQALRFYVGATF